jgi:hypothetical protein
MATVYLDRGFKVTQFDSQQSKQELLLHSATDKVTVHFGNLVPFFMSSDLVLSCDCQTLFQLLSAFPT